VYGSDKRTSLLRCGKRFPAEAPEDFLFFHPSIFFPPNFFMKFPSGNSPSWANLIKFVTYDYLQQGKRLQLLISSLTLNTNILTNSEVI
jgi:hypothetical protein